MESVAGPGSGGGWFCFGFRSGVAAEAGLAPAPLSLEAPGLVCWIRPSWSFAGIVTAGAGAGASCGGAGSAAGERPASRSYAGTARRVLLRGAVTAALPGDCRDLLPSETHVLLLREASLEAWPAAGAILNGQPAWRQELTPEEAAATELPLVPGGYVAPCPPFFTPLPASLQARQLVLGLEHALLLAAGGRLFSWGGGRHGQLGHGDLESRREPRTVEALEGLPAAAVAAGGWHSAAVSEAGDLYMWGWNESGQLGLPSKTKTDSLAANPLGEAGGGTTGVLLAPGDCKATFISIQALPALLDLPEEAEVRSVSCGSRHTAAVTCTGLLYTWGWGKYGQLGHRDTASSDEPRRVCYFAEKGLSVQDAICGPWTTYAQAVRVGSKPSQRP